MRRLLILCALAALSACGPAEEAKILVLVFTDIGRDVDDAEALCCLAGSSHVQIAGVVCSGMVPRQRARIAQVLLRSVGVGAPVAAGSALPLGCTDSTLTEKYEVAHAYEKEIFDAAFGTGGAAIYPDAARLIDSVAALYGARLRLVVLSQATDVALALERNPRVFDHCAGLYYQGQAGGGTGRLTASSEAYNTREDTLAAAAMFRLQDRVPFTLVGKYAAYPAALTRADLGELAATGRPAGIYIRDAAIGGLEAFALREPAVFRRVYAVADSVEVGEALARIDRCSNPYDALTVMALLNPGLFEAVPAGRHVLIGQSVEAPGVPDPQMAKNEMLGLMFDALR